MRDRAETVLNAAGAAEWSTHRLGWDGRHLYVFGERAHGGEPSPFTRIGRVDPVTKAFTLTGASLPSDRTVGPVIWDGRRFLIVGGRQDSATRSTVDEVLAFEPGADRIGVLATRLPPGTVADAAVWACDTAVLFGSIGRESVALSFDPASGATAMLGRLPRDHLSLEAAGHGSDAYLFATYSVLEPKPDADFEAHDNGSMVVRFGPLR